MNPRFAGIWLATNVATPRRIWKGDGGMKKLNGIALELVFVLAVHVFTRLPYTNKASRWLDRLLLATEAT